MWRSNACNVSIPARAVISWLNEARFSASEVLMCKRGCTLRATPGLPEQLRAPGQTHRSTIINYISAAWLSGSSQHLSDTCASFWWIFRGLQIQFPSVCIVRLLKEAVQGQIRCRREIEGWTRHDSCGRKSALAPLSSAHLLLSAPQSVFSFQCGVIQKFPGWDRNVNVSSNLTSCFPTPCLVNLSVWQAARLSGIHVGTIEEEETIDPMGAEHLKSY